mmetsp:Transcript_14383/g.33481  ORF Transcript_14383/g.33481 Transcript_14383/m.33481 type:complete len:183 (-) Transcript_14383:379-927(-)
MTHSRMFNRHSSDSTISTTASLRHSGSSSFLRSSSRTSVKASRTAKYKVKRNEFSRWRAPDRRDSSLTTMMGRRQSSRDIRSNQSQSSILGRSLESLRLGNTRNEKFDPRVEAIDACSDPHICIKSVELQEALHRDIDSHPVDGNSDNSRFKDRWSSESGGENTLFKPKRRGSDDNLKKSTA